MPELTGTTNYHSQKSVNLSRISTGLFISTLIYMIADQIMMIALANYIPTIAGDSGSLFGLTSSFLVFGSLIMVVPLAKLSEKWGRKRILMISSVNAAMGIFLLYFADQVWLIFLARFIIGLSSTSAVVTALIHDHFPPEKRGINQGLQSIAMVVGYLIASVVGGFFYVWFGDHDIFVFIGSLRLITIWVIAVMIKDAPLNPEQHNHESTNVKLKFLFRSEILKKKDLLGSYILAFFASICFGGAGTYGVYMIFVYFGQPAEIGGLYGIGATIMEVIVFFIVGARAKNFSKFYKYLSIVAAIFLGLGVYFLFFEKFWVFVIAITVSGIILAGLMQGADTIFLLLVPEDHKSDLIGIYKMITLTGNMLGPALFGLMVDFIWAFSPAVFMSISVFVSAIIYWKWIDKGL